MQEISETLECEHCASNNRAAIKEKQAAESLLITVFFTEKQTFSIKYPFCGKFCEAASYRKKRGNSWT